VVQRDDDKVAPSFNLKQLLDLIQKIEKQSHFKNMTAQGIRYRGNKVGIKQRQLVHAKREAARIHALVKEAQDALSFDQKDADLRGQTKAAKALAKSDAARDPEQPEYVPPEGEPVIQRDEPIADATVLRPIVRQRTFSVAALQRQMRDNQVAANVNMAQTAKRERAHYRGFGPVLAARADRKVVRIQAELDDLIEQQKLEIQYQENIERLRSYVAKEGGIDNQPRIARAVLDRATTKKKKRKRQPAPEPRGVDDDHENGDDGGDSDDDDDGDASRASNKKQ
jgi:hypothetical protein